MVGIMTFIPQPLLQLMQDGGPLMPVLLLIAVLQVALAVERLLTWPRLRRETYHTGYRLAVRALHQQSRALLEGRIVWMKALVAICPLLGLLGTVTGMMQVFDVVASGLGTSPRVLSAGIARATLPTMAGMAVAVTGLMLLGQWQRQVRVKLQHLGAQA